MKKHYIELKDLFLSLPFISREKGENECLRVLQEKITVLSALRKTFDAAQDKEQMMLFQSILLSLLLESEFVNHVYNKPYGYAGDFITQEMIWFANMEGEMYQYLGISEVGKLLSALMFKMENSLANINRINYLKKQLTDSGKRIASIGCGSCIELWDFDQEFLNKKDIFLLDQDHNALERAKQKIDHKENIQFVQENVLLFLAKNKQNNILGQKDLIYLFGLIDYFCTKSAKKIIELLWKNVAPGGKLIFTNAHPDNPNRFLMEYGGEWFILYKNEQEMYSIIENIPDIANINFFKDQFNVYLYLEITKNDK